MVLILLYVATALKADDVDLSNAAPAVVKEIKVTYSKEMADGSWSWSTAGKDNFPEMTGKPHYLEDKRTCVVPVKLKPGKTYAIWLNSQKFGNFKDADGRSAVPYLLVFKTSGTAATTQPADPGK
jgi:RNA polymerase sigma-70 factor (ECF subfamily)